MGAAGLAIASCMGNNKNTAAIEPQGPMAQHYPGVGLLGYGAMRFPTTDSEDGRKVIDQSKVNELIDYALEHGVTYYDTAPIYHQGASEAALGEALSRHPRNSYTIATKLSNFRVEEGRGYEQGVEMFNKSLKDLKTDYFDYYLLHSVSGFKAFKTRYIDTGLMDFVLQQKEKGVIKHLGFSFHGSEQGFLEMMELHEKYNWDFVQIQMNYSDWYSDDGEASEFMYNELDKREIPVVIMEPLLGGRLANIPAKLADQLLSRRPQDSVASWAFRFCGSYPRILSVLSGMTYMDHLKDNIGTFCGFEPLEESDYELLKETAIGLKTYSLVDCTDCKYCIPCPYGIDIPGIFKFYNKHLVEGSYIVNSEQQDYEKIRRRYLKDYNKSIESIRQADHCIGCRECTSLCPQELEIPDILHSINDYLELLKQDKI